MLQNTQDVPSILTVENTAKKYAQAGFTTASLRWLLFNREHNGFVRCVIRNGRRVLIDEGEFVAWLRDQREVRAA
jgi:hypothetical protein